MSATDLTRALAYLLLLLTPAGSAALHAQAADASAVAAAAAVDSVTLPGLRALAAERALDVLVAERDRRVAALEVARLRADLRPQLRLEASLPNYLSSFRETLQPDGTVQFKRVTQNNSFVGLRAAQALPWTGGDVFVSTGLQRFDDFEAGTKTYNGSVLRVGYRQPLFGYNDLKWRRALVPARAEAAEREYRAARQAAALAATRLFFQLAAADQAYTIADSNVQASTRLLVISEERYALGKISRGDLVQLELDLASARQNLLRADQLRLGATARVVDLTGDAFAGVRLRPVVPGFAAAEEIVVEAALAQAQRYRPEALTAQALTLEAEGRLEQDRRDNGFRADLTASLGLIRSADDLPTVYRAPQPEQIVELGLSVPLVDWGRRRAIARQGEAEVELARALGARAQQSLETQVRLAVLQFNQARRELELQTTVRDLAEERYQISLQSYVLGAVPLTELTLARQARDQRAREYLGALELAWTAYADLSALTLYDFLNDTPL